jgi:hypothetical protein
MRLGGDLEEATTATVAAVGARAASNNIIEAETRAVADQRRRKDRRRRRNVAELMMTAVNRSETIMSLRGALLRRLVRGLATATIRR